MVGRSLPLAFLCVWIKCRERGGAGYGEEGFRDTRLAVVAGLKSRIGFFRERFPSSALKFSFWALFFSYDQCAPRPPGQLQKKSSFSLSGDLLHSVGRAKLPASF